MMQKKESGCFSRIILLSFISLTTSLFTVKRYGEGDWFNGTGNIKCVELSAYMDSSGSGCRCHYGKTLSTETELMCRTYKERGILADIYVASQLFQKYHQGLTNHQRVSRKHWMQSVIMVKVKAKVKKNIQKCVESKVKHVIKIGAIFYSYTLIIAADCGTVTVNIAFYRFQRKEIYDTYVTELNADCTANGFCTLISTAAKAELPIEKSLHRIPLNTESGCEVNFVEIIHDCIPRCVDLKFVFESHDYSTDYLYLYLKLNRTVQLDYLEGELFQADVSCRADNTNGKLLFKFSGTRILSDNGSFPNIPPYNRSATYCSTNSESHPDALIIGASVGGAVMLVIILVFMIICCTRCRGFCRCKGGRYEQMATGDIDIGNT